MIRKLLLLTFIIITINTARDLSCRMRALGDDFALLIPDYETDVFYNPIFLNKNLVGVYYNTMEETQIKLNFLYHSFGFYGMYWPSYYHYLEPQDDGWQTYTQFNDRLKSTFLFKIKTIGLSITPDISRYRVKEWNSTNYKNLSSWQNFLGKSSVGIKINNKFFLFIEPALGFLEELEQTQDINTKDQRIIILSGRLNVLYRDIKEENRFVSANLEIGGPTSLSDIGGLPFNPFGYYGPFDKEILPFYNYFQANSGFCLGLPVGDNLMITLGLREEYDLQIVLPKVYTHDNIYLAINNKVSSPIAIEYKLNRIALRCGAIFFYNYSNSEYGNGSLFERVDSFQTKIHELGYSFTFGLGWQPKEKFKVDLKYSGGGSILGLNNWSIYLSYLI